MLTKKQRDLLLFIHQRMAEGDVAPSFDEMKDALKLKSKSGIHRLITGLVERGYLERLPHRARALEVKKLPEGYKPGAADRTIVAQVSRNVASVYEQARSTLANLNELPLYGKIAAGTPIEAVRDEITTVAVPNDLVGTGEHYALTVEGDSMVEAGIHDKDTVIIKRCDSAENGTIVVALVDGEEVTLKRLRRAGGKIVLEPENSAYEPRILEPNRVKIQGRLMGLMRSYH